MFRSDKRARGAEATAPAGAGEGEFARATGTYRV